MQQSLWSFAVALYARPGVAELCLRLQDDADADVCLLLAALWLERRGVAATPERIARIAQLARPWRQTVIAPLRELRRAWKHGAGTDAGLAELRRQLAELELRAERLLLERIEALTKDWPETDAAASDIWLEALAPACRDELQALRIAAGQPDQS